MSGVSWSCYGGDEVANGNRALTYARASGDPRLTIALAAALIPEPDGPVPENLAAFCAAIEDDARTPETVTYRSPADDPAPWYTSSRADSAEFLGLHLTDVRVGSVIGRSVTPRTLGASLGPLRRAQRVVSFTGTMFASSERGMRFGERWLNDVLSGSDCDRGSDLHVLLACDPDTERVLPWAGILEPGVILSPSGDRVPDCLLQQAAFQLASPLPWLEHLPEQEASGSLTSEAETVSALVTGPEWTGDVAVVVEVVTGAGVDGLTVSAAVPVAGECPTDRAPFAFCTVTLGPNRSLRIDSARREVTVTETSSGLVVGGMDALTFDGLFRWIEAGACTTVCVTVGGGSFTDGDTTVTVTSVAREL